MHYMQKYEASCIFEDHFYYYKSAMESVNAKCSETYIQMFKNVESEIMGHISLFIHLLENYLSNKCTGLSLFLN